MGLLLKLIIEDPEACTFDSVKCTVTLTNESKKALELPSLDDVSNALSFEIYDDKGTLLRRDSALTQQRLNRRGPGSVSSQLITIKPWHMVSHHVDLACMHLPPACGSFQVLARFDVPASAIDLRSEKCAVEIRDAGLDDLTVIRDNPILDALTLLFRNDEEPQSRYFLRLHGRRRPLAARYTGQILADREVKDVYCATQSAAQSASFDGFYHRWVIWREGRKLHAQAFERGEAIAETSKCAEIPRGATMLPSAYCEGDHRLFVFGYDEYGAFRSYQFGEEELVPALIYHLPSNNEGPPTIGVDGSHIHILTAKRGLTYVKLDHRGAMVKIKKLFKSRLKLHSCRYSAEESCFKAIMWSGGKAKDLQFHVIYPDRGEHKCSEIAALNIRGEIREVAFDCDSRGRFHYLVSTSKKQLLYFRDGRGPLSLAKGEEKYFPYMVASDQPYLGFYRRQLGYRFLQFDDTRQRPRIIDFGG